MPKIVKALSEPETKRITTPGFHAVGGIPGLLLQVTETGARSWVLRALIGGKRRSMGLGNFPAVTVAEARKRAQEARSLIDRGADPILARREAKSALKAAAHAARTFAQCTDGFLDAKGDEWRNPKHRAQWRSTLETYAHPILGDMLVKDVGLPHVLKVLEPIWREKQKPQAGCAVASRTYWIGQRCADTARGSIPPDGKVIWTRCWPHPRRS